MLSSLQGNLGDVYHSIVVGEEALQENFFLHLEQVVGPVGAPNISEARFEAQDHLEVPEGGTSHVLDKETSLLIVDINAANVHKVQIVH